MDEPYPPLTPVSTHTAADPTPGRNRIDKMTGMIGDSSATSRPGYYRYVILFTPDQWNASGRRPTDQIETLRFYSDELTPLEEI